MARKEREIEGTFRCPEQRVAASPMWYDNTTVWTEKRLLVLLSLLKRFSSKLGAREVDFQCSCQRVFRHFSVAHTLSLPSLSALMQRNSLCKAEGWIFASTGRVWK